MKTHGVESWGFLLEAVEDVLVVALHGSLAVDRGGKSIAVIVLAR